MATGERGEIFKANEIEDMLEKRSEEYQRIKASYEAWSVDQQQKIQAETEKLQNELGQLRKNLDDAGMEDSRATKELGQLFSRPLMHRDDSPDIEELFAEAERWNSDFCRIRENRDRPDEDRTAIMRNIENIQNKLEGLPAAYDLARKEETRKLRKQLGELWQPQSQPGSSNTNFSNYAAQKQTTLLRGDSSLAAEGFSPVFSAEAHQSMHERSREVSLEIISPTEFEQSASRSRPDSHSFPNPKHTRVPDNGRTSGVFMITPQHGVPKPSSNAAMLFRDRRWGYQAERATPGRQPQEYKKLGLAPPPAFSRFGPLDADFFPNAYAEGTRVNKESNVRHRLDNADNRLSSTQKSHPDNDTIIVTTVDSGRRQLPISHDTQERKRRQSQVSSSDPESDLPLATRHKKAEMTMHFDQVNAENKNWRRGEKIYRITEYHIGSDDWYIFPCESHCTGLASAREAAKHLRRLSHGQRLSHGHARWTFAQAVKELGVRVIGCNSEKSTRNNEAFVLAQAEGYRSDRRCNNSNCPIHGTSGGRPRHSDSSQRHQSEVLEDSDSHSDEVYPEMPKGRGGDARVSEVRQQPNSSPIVLDPVPGELYQAYWTSDGSWYPATVLPWGDLGEVGLAGSLDETALFKEKLPPCFAVEDSQDGLRIVGWKKDFELHSRRVSERKFPCMFFEGTSEALAEDDNSPRPFENLSWVMAKHLRPFKYHHPDDHLFEASGLAEAKAFRKRVIRLKNKATRETSRVSLPLVDDDNDDVFDVHEESRPKHSTQDKGVKTEPDSDWGF